MSGGTRHISVTVPSGSLSSPRAAVARQSLQTALNRSIPAQGQGVEDFSKLNTRKPSGPQVVVPSQRMVRTAPSGTTGPGAATNEFVGRSRTGASRQPAKTNIIDFGAVPLHPRERLNIRGIDGFFPPLRMKSGSGSGKFVISETISTAWGPKSGLQDTDSPQASLQHFSVELAPHHADLGPDSVPHHHTLGNNDWLQRRNNNVVFNNSITHGNGHVPTDTAQISPRNPRRSRSPPIPEVTSLQRKKDAAWVRAFKVKQNRNNRYKEMELGSKSMTNLEEGSRKWGLSD